MKIKQGFTLIEMLITVIVIALIMVFFVTLMLSKYKESKLNSDAAKIISEISQIISSEEIYYMKNSVYGTKEELLNSGILKSWPIPPEGIFDSECIATSEPFSGYELKTVSIENVKKNNLYVVLPCLKKDVADVVNVLTLAGTPNLK